MNAVMHNVRHFLRYCIDLIYHVGNGINATRAHNANIDLAVLSAIIIAWLWMAALVGRQAAHKGQSFAYGFFLSLLAGPVIGVLFTATLRPLKGAGKRASSKPVAARGERTRSFARDRVA